MSSKMPKAAQASFTKEEGIKAYENHPAARWIKFAFKYFSKSTEKENMKPGKAIVGILLSLFLVGFIATVANLPRAVIAIATISYSIILAILVLFLLAAVTVNNRRIKKVIKELGCTIEEWNRFVDAYGDELK